MSSHYYSLSTFSFPTSSSLLLVFSLSFLLFLSPPPVFLFFTPAWLLKLRARFANVMQKLPSDMMDEISDVLSDLCEHKPYNHLKEAILKRTGRSEEDMIQEILRNVTRGDKTLTQLLSFTTALTQFTPPTQQSPNATSGVRQNGRWRTCKDKYEKSRSPCTHEQGNRPRLDNIEEPPVENGEATRAFVGFLAHLAMEPGTADLPVHTRRLGETSKPEGGDD
ncbi:unnamed protein product [Acanthosepion pharaonis]|uniref:DUF7041 domain-containing protein n=1 Tax=Acanthosepion pharaonis TaxID=158019 RepID=A0A812CXK4_ACAPH|nr:unnamed protein product [Sepia pharaonis]